jgi:hypothetical protein
MIAARWSRSPSLGLSKRQLDGSVNTDLTTPLDPEDAVEGCGREPKVLGETARAARMAAACTAVIQPLVQRMIAAIHTSRRRSPRRETPSCPASFRVSCVSARSRRSLGGWRSHRGSGRMSRLYRRNIGRLDVTRL